MIYWDSKTSQEKYAANIRQNYFDLFDCLAGIFPNSAVPGDGYSAIQVPGMEWPKTIYNLLFDEVKANLLDQLSKGISNAQLPQLLMIDELSKPEHFDTSVRNFRFIPVARWKGMIFDLQSFQIPQASADLSIKAVEDTQLLSAWISIQNQVFFKQEGIRSDEFEKLLGHSQFQLSMGYEASTPVSALMVFTHGNVAGLYLVATLANYTRRGYMTRMVTDTLQKLKEDGFAYCILGSTDQSHLPYQRIGFKDICTFDVFWKSR